MGVGLPVQCSEVVPHQPHCEQHKLRSAQTPLPIFPDPQGTLFPEGVGANDFEGASVEGALDGRLLLVGSLVVGSLVGSITHLLLV